MNGDDGEVLKPDEGAGRQGWRVAPTEAGAVFSTVAGEASGARTRDRREAASGEWRVAARGG